jgi:hypothetical protein
MSIQIDEHSLKGWQQFSSQAGFVPDPMILRTGEVFLNGLTGSNALGRLDLDVWAALKDNIAGLTDFFDLVVTRDRIPLIDYNYTFDKDTVAQPLERLLESKALPVTIGYIPYGIVKQGAFNSLKGIDLPRVQAFGRQLTELDSLRYDWQPKLEDYRGPESWLSHAAELDEDTIRAAKFLLGGFIFSGFAQASETEHYIQPKRSRFFLSLTAAPNLMGQLTHDDEQPIFDAAIEGLEQTMATVHKLDGLPPVLPYLIAKAPANATAPDILKLALEFPQTTDGKRYCEAAAAVRGDGVQAVHAKDAALAARKEAIALLRPFTQLAEHDGGFKVEASVGMEGPKASLSKELRPPAWLQLWWNDHTPFGGIRKTFRRMWIAKESYDRFEKQIHDIWARS